VGRRGIRQLVLDIRSIVMISPEEYRLLLRGWVRPQDLGPPSGQAGRQEDSGRIR
jgi:hypothetical protein